MKSRRWLLLLACALLPLAACGHSNTPRFIMATSFARFPRGTAPTAQLTASAKAENQARDKVLAQALQLTFPNGVSLSDAAVRDPFIRAKLYDVIRGARITDKTITDDEIVSVTVRLDMDDIYKILETYPAPEPGI